MNDRKAKLKSFKEKKELKKLPVIADGKPFIDAFEAKIKSLANLFDDGVELHADDLLQELGQINYLKDDLGKLNKSIKDLYIPEFPKKLKVDGLDSLLKALKALDTKQIDLQPIQLLTEQVGNLISKVEEIQVPKQGQLPTDYIPTRRVMMVGKKLMYDDSFYTGGGSGGTNIPTKNGAVPVVNPDGTPIGSSGGSGLTDTELRASPVEVDDINQKYGNNKFAGSLSTTVGQNYLEDVINATDGAVTLVTQIHVAQSILFYFGGTHDGTLNFEASLSDGIWVPINVTPAGGGAEITSTTATDGIFIAPLEAWGQFRIRGSNWVSGSVSAGVSDLALPYKNTVKIFGAVTVTNDNTFAKETGGNLAEIALDTDNLAGIKTDLDEIAVDTDNLAGIKTDLDEIATDTDKLDVNLSTRALESGGNLATLAGKDFATQTTLALIKAKTDNLDTALSGIKTGTDKIISAPATAANQATEIANLQALNSLTPSTYDYISLSYTGSDLTTVVFKSGGAGGSTISTLTLAYSSSILQSVTKT